MKKSKKLFALLSSLVIMAGLVVGGGGLPAEASDIVVAFSSGSSGTLFRTIGIEDFRQAGEELMAAGRIKDFKIVNNVVNRDATEQANIIRDFINDPDINVIIINPNSRTDLNGVLAEAVAAGNVVVAVDAEVDVPGVISVSINHYDWATKNAEWITSVRSSGNAIHITGNDGHPANEERIRATHDVLAKFPDIRLIAETTGRWNNHDSKQVTEQILGGGHDIDIVFTQDSMAAGILSAFLDLGKLPDVMFGECGTQFIRMWRELRDQGVELKFAAQPNPPSIVRSGLLVALGIAEGKTLKADSVGGLYGSTVYYPVVSWFTHETADDLWTFLEGTPDDWLHTESFTEEQAAALFE